MNLFKSFLSGLLSITLLSSCSLFRNEKSINKTFSSLPEIKNQFIPTILWRSSIGNNVGDFYSNLHPAFANGIVYAANRNGTVCAFNANNGKKIWSVNLVKNSCCLSYSPSLLSSGITVSGSHIYIGSEKACLYSLNANNGSIAWQANVAGEVLSHPVVSNGIILIHTSNGQLQALNESDGTVQWTMNLGVPFLSIRGESSPAIVSNTDIAIIGSDNGYIYAIHVRHGQIIWKQCIFQINSKSEINRLNDIDTTPIVVNNLVYASSYGGNLAALDLQSGKIIWNREFGSVNNFIVNNNRIYLVDQNDRLLSLSAENGVTLWIQNDLFHRLLTAPVLYNKKLLVIGDRKGYIHWIDLETGHFISRQKINSSGFLTEPVMTDKKLLIQARNGMLYAIMLC